VRLRCRLGQSTRFPQRAHHLQKAIFRDFRPFSPPSFDFLPFSPISSLPLGPQAGCKRLQAPESRAIRHIPALVLTPACSLLASACPWAVNMRSLCEPSFTSPSLMPTCSYAHMRISEYVQFVNHGSPFRMRLCPSLLCFWAVNGCSPFEIALRPRSSLLNERSFIFESEPMRICA